MWEWAVIQVYSFPAWLANDNNILFSPNRGKIFYALSLPNKIQNVTTFLSSRYSKAFAAVVVTNDVNYRMPIT